MSDPLQVTAHDFRNIRVFDFNLPDSEIKALMARQSGPDGKDIWPLRDALGVTYLDEDFIEFFDVADLGDLGLCGYLREGNDIPEDQIESKRVELENIAGPVLLVFSDAFGGFAQSLTPSKDLTFVGLFHEQGPDWSAKPMHSDSAAPYSAQQLEEAREAKRARQIVLTLLAALTLVVTLVLLKVFL